MRGEAYCVKEPTNNQYDVRNQVAHALIATSVHIRVNASCSRRGERTLNAI